MSQYSEQFKARLERLLQEEELDLYILTTHYRNDGEMTYFNTANRQRIKNIFDTLIHDTKQHSEILKRLIGPGI